MMRFGGYAFLLYSFFASDILQMQKMCGQEQIFVVAGTKPEKRYLFVYWFVLLRAKLF